MFIVVYFKSVIVLVLNGGARPYARLRKGHSDFLQAYYSILKEAAAELGVVYSGENVAPLALESGEIYGIKMTHGDVEIALRLDGEKIGFGPQQCQHCGSVGGDKRCPKCKGGVKTEASAKAVSKTFAA